MRLFIVVCILAALAVPAHAEEPTTEDIVRALQPKPAPPLTRSVEGMINLDGKRGAKQGEKPVRERGVTVNLDGKPEPSPAVDLQVNFAFNSAALTTDAEITLANLGRALADPRLAGYRFRLEGHTDAVGSETYNQALSERRAAAVKRYLQQHHAIAPARLLSVGFGESRLADPARPEAAINRRVRVVNVGAEGG